MNADLLLLHIAQTQHADSMVLHHIAEMLANNQATVPPELSAVLAESKAKHAELKAALDSAKLPPPPEPAH